MGKRVCLVTSAHRVRYTRFFDREAVSLARAGYEVSLVGLGAPDDAAREQDVSLVPVPARGGVRKAATLRDIHRVVRELEPDVCHCFDPWAMAVGLRLGRELPSAVLVYDSTELFPDAFSDRDDLPWPLPVIGCRSIEVIEARAARRCAAVIETNPTRAARFARHNVTPHIVGNYPPLELLPGIRPDREPWIAWTGLISRQRGFDRLLRAFSRVAPDFPGSKLVVIGGFDPRSDIEKWAKAFLERSGLGERVELRGTVEYREMFRQVARCLAGVILLQPERSNDYTGQPNKLFEFMGSGLAVVASGFPEMAGIIRQERCGSLVDPTDESAIAGALKAIFTQPAQALETGRRGRVAVEREYNWSSAESVLLKVYEGLFR